MLGTHVDNWGSYELHLVFLKQPSGWETVSVQTSHVRAQLYFCGVTCSTRNILAVHSVLFNTERTVLHCYALLWSNGWHIIHGDGKTTSLSFSLQQQTIPELVGATIIQLFSLVGRAEE